MKTRSLAFASLFLFSAIPGEAETNSITSTIPAVGLETNLPAITLEEINITATRIATPQEKSPVSSTIITQDQIEQSQQHLVADILRGQPGVEVVRNGQPGAVEAVRLRGANNNQTLVLVDGIRANSPFNNQFDFSQLAVDNIDRIEILRGPQSTLYGSEAGGGVINIITKRGTCLPAGGVEMEGGSFKTQITRGGFSGSAGRFSMVASGNYASSDNDRINSDYRQYHFDGHVRYDFSDQLNATLLATYFHNDDGVPGDIFTADPTARLKTESSLLGLTLKGLPTTWWDTKLTLSHSRERGSFDQPANAENYFTDFHSQTVAQRNQVDFQNVFKPSSQHKILVGGTWEEAAADLSANGTWGPSALASTIYTRSLYGQYDFMPIERVTLAAGGRVDDSTSFGSHGTYRFGGRFTAPGLKTIFRASAGTGLRAPSISDLYYPYYGNPNLKPEESLSWDAGFEQPLLENKFRFGATFFHNDFDNLIQYSGTKPENVGRARTFGVETFAAWQVLSNLTARAIYTWTDSEDLSTGQELLRRPEHNGSLNLNWQISLKLTADAKATLIGTRSDKNFNTYPAKTVDLTAYTKLDFALRWQLHKHFQIFARAENLTDERYQEAFGYPALGRGFYGGLRAQF
ncbi:MAG: TonB-dependent receptor [Verrucomicrobiota bacterium]